MASLIDQRIGARLKAARALRQNMTQVQLGERTGISAQQIDKYERGQNRIAMSRLIDLAGALNLHRDFFFEGIDDTGEALPAFTKRELELLRHFRALPDPLQSPVLTIIRCLGECDQETPR
jgi:transcriptional regulator with XRE-family HTH domain